MSDIIFKLIECNSQGREELARFASDGKYFFSKNLTVENALPGITSLSDKLYDIPNLYNTENVGDLENAKEIMKDLVEKLQNKIEIGEM